MTIVPPLQEELVKCFTSSRFRVEQLAVLGRVYLCVGNFLTSHTGKIIQIQPEAIYSKFNENNKNNNLINWM